MHKLAVFFLLKQEKYNEFIPFFRNKIAANTIIETEINIKSAYEHYYHNKRCKVIHSNPQIDMKTSYFYMFIKQCQFEVHIERYFHAKFEFIACIKLLHMLILLKIIVNVPCIYS